jgi:hypothetical protein
VELAERWWTYKARCLSSCARLLDEPLGGRLSINRMRLTISIRNTKHLKQKKKLGID